MPVQLDNILTTCLPPPQAALRPRSSRFDWRATQYNADFPTPFVRKRTAVLSPSFLPDQKKKSNKKPWD
jgi:hypothetical protein